MRGIFKINMESRNSLYADILEMQGVTIYEYLPDEDTLSFYIISSGREHLARRITDFRTWGDTFTEEEKTDKDIRNIRELWRMVINGEEIDTFVVSSFFSESKDDKNEYKVRGKKRVDISGKESYMGFVKFAGDTKDILYSDRIDMDLVKDSAIDVYDKRSITEYCKRIISDTPNKTFYIAVLDLDNFKNINDNFGHFFGDDVLITVSEVIKEAIKDVGKVGRFGGDEFFIVFDKISDRETTRLVLKNLREKVEAAFKGKTGDFAVTCSVGSCAYPECGKNFDEVFRVADTLLYLAKEKGRNRYILYRDDLHKDLVEKVLNADTEGKVAELFDDMSVFWNRSNLMDHIISDFLCNGTMSLSDVLDIIQDRFFVDYIQIVNTEKNYYYEQIEKIPTDGISSSEFLDINDGFVSEFKGLNYFRANNLMAFKNPSSGGKEFMKNHKISTAVFYLVKQDDKPVGYVMFGKVKDNRKWAEQDSLVLTTIAQIISIKS